MKNLSSLIVVYFFTYFPLAAQLVTTTPNADIAEKEITPYINFIKKNQLSPLEYIFQLYEKNDIVILGERDHRDTTQYDLILKLIADNRFIENVGNIFLEVGTISQSDLLQNLLKENIPDSVFIKRLTPILREIEFYPLWEKYNYYKFMLGIFQINKHLSDSLKINVYLTDVAFSWEDMTEEKYQDFINKLSVNNRMGRDSMMATNFINQYEQLLSPSFLHRKKALIIYNGPHSYGKFDCFNTSSYTNYTGKYILEKYKGKAANVMLNWTRWRHNNEPIAEGKWDAAFRMSENSSIGFDFENSPFGDDFFDQDDSLCTYARYKDVYTGFIYYLPPKEWVCTIGIPNIVDDNFLTELVRRHNIIGQKNLPPENLKHYYNTVNSFPCLNNEIFEKHIKRWIE